MAVTESLGRRTSEGQLQDNDFSISLPQPSVENKIESKQTNKFEYSNDDENATSTKWKDESLGYEPTKNINETHSVEQGLFIINITQNPCQQNHRKDRRGKCRKVARS